MPASDREKLERVHTRLDFDERNRKVQGVADNRRKCGLVDLACVYGRSTRMPRSNNDRDGSFASSSALQQSIVSGTYKLPSGARPSNKAHSSEVGGAWPRVVTKRMQK